MKSRRLRIHVAVSRLHRWLALVIGAQLLIWCASGLVMSILPIERVRGDHMVAKNAAAPLPMSAIQFLPPLRDEHRPVVTLSIAMVLDRAVVTIGYADGSLRMVDITSRRGLRIDQAFAQRIARAAYQGSAVAVRTEAVTRNSTEYRGTLPAWRIAFEDDEATRIYIDPNTGRIAAVRTGTWRLYDFFWGIHIMDWKNHEDFNTPWLMGFAVGGLVLAIAGSVLLYLRWPRRRRRRVASGMGDANSATGM